MKYEEFENVYPTPPEDFHNAVLSSLCRLDGKAPVRRRHRRAVKIAVVCAAVIAVGTVSAVAASTKMFGLLAEPVGKYGLRLSVESSIPDTRPVGKIKYYRPKLGYLPEGYSEVPNSEGLKYCDENGEKVFSFMAVPAADFDYTEEYIVRSEKSTVNGNRFILATRQMTEDGETDYIATEYFEKEAFVVQCFAYDGAPKDELKKIFEHLTLEEYEPGFIVEEPSYSDLDQKRMNYMFKDNTEYKEYKVGEAIDWLEYSGKDDSDADFTVTVKSITEKTDTSGIPAEYFTWMTDYSLIYDDYFDADGKLITPYTRTDIAFGDGIHTQDKHTQTQTGRHFYLAEIEVTCHGGEEGLSYDVMGSVVPQILHHSSADRFSGDEKIDRELQPAQQGDCGTVCCTPGEEANMMNMKQGEKRSYTIGFVTDEDVLDKTYLVLQTRSDEIIDDDAQTITLDTTFQCVKIKE